MKRKRDGMFYCEVSCSRCRAVSACAWLGGRWVCQWCTSIAIPHLEAASLQDHLGRLRVVWSVRVGAKIETRSAWIGEAAS